MAFLSPGASSFAEPVDALIARLFWICLFFGVLVQVLLVVALIRFRRKKAVKALHYHGNHALEVAWALVPCAILVWLAFASQSLWARIRLPPSLPVDATEVEVLAQQFAWNVRYPGKDGLFGASRPEFISDENPFGRVPDDAAGEDDVILINEMSLIADKPARLVLRSRDVIHSFFIPEFRFKQDAVPGTEMEVWFLPTRSGDFEIACAEFCGLAHYRMRGLLSVQTAAEHDQWLTERK